MGIVSFIGTVLLTLIITGLVAIILFILFLRYKVKQFQQKMKDAQQQAGGSQNTNSQQTGYQQTTSQQNTANKERKIFQQEEGEYVDFEEIKK